MTGWTVIVPIRSWTTGKTRLGGDADVRGTLARAIALDTVEAIVGCGEVGRVLVVTPDAEVAADVARLGAVVVPEPSTPSGDPLNAAIDRAAASTVGPVAVVLGDVPALTAADLAQVLRGAAAHPSAFVPDAEGTGTVLLAARSVDVLVPCFGPGSAVAHAATGAARLDAPDAVRRDVDTPQDADEARRLGVGPRTAVLLG